jgi:hypothetical protein
MNIIVDNEQSLGIKYIPLVYFIEIWGSQLQSLPSEDHKGGIRYSIQITFSMVDLKMQTNSVA